jgi:hypothetical protein
VLVANDIFGIRHENFSAAPGHEREVILSRARQTQPQYQLESAFRLCSFVEGILNLLQDNGFVGGVPSQVEVSQK